MALSNTADRYGTVTKTLHWATVLMIATVIPLGIIGHDLAKAIEDPAIATTQADIDRAAFLFSLHKTIGLTIFFTAIARILWTVSNPKPGLLNGDKRAEAFLAETVHWLLYGSLILVPLTGWVHHAATTGFAPIWWPFGQSLPFVPKDPGVADTFGSLHIIFERVLVLAIVLHVAGALKHHFVDRDFTLRRMWFGHSDAPTPPEHNPVRASIVAALGIWGAALGIGAGMGLFSHAQAGKPVAPELADVESQWQVQEGTLAITVTQFGSQVEGSFADWTADITYDAVPGPEPDGEVTVTVSIPSLTLGSVTDQALGADFFDAESHPTATFTATLNDITDGHRADGTLTIKGQTVPLSFPFVLGIDGDTARVNADIPLNRMDFGIGANMPDESSLAFAVEVSVSLTATRTNE